MGKSEGVEAQFWATESGLTTPNYANKYGIPQINVSNADFLEIGQIKLNTPFITRPAPAVGTNIGGGIEAVTPVKGVNVNSFSTLGKP